jgi:hypothetical protein
MALKSFLGREKQGAMRGLRFDGSQRSYALHSNRVDMQVGNEGVPHFAQACGLAWIGSASLDDEPMCKFRFRPVPQLRGSGLSGKSATIA